MLHLCTMATYFLKNLIGYSKTVQDAVGNLYHSSRKLYTIQKPQTRTGWSVIGISMAKCISVLAKLIQYKKNVDKGEYEPCKNVLTFSFFF